MAVKRYFHILQGLRGCYMPDNAYVVACSTRRELKACIEEEARAYRDAGFVGGSKRAIAQFVAECWREAAKEKPAHLPFCLPFAREREGNKTPNYCFGVFVSAATRCEFIDWRRETENN